MASTGSVNNRDLLALQAYITANDATQYSHMAADTIMLDLTHSNLKQRHAEVRFDRHDNVSELRRRIHQKTGTPPSSQHLKILRGISLERDVIFEIPPGADDAKMLGYYSLENGMTVHCVDVDPYSASRGGAYEDTSLVKKYRMTEEEYDQRKGTLRDWERRKKEKDPTFNLAKHAREHREMAEAQRQAKLGLPLPEGFEYDSGGKAVRVEHNEPSSALSAMTKDESPASEEHGPDSVSAIGTGMRCEVRPGGRRGAVAFVGEVPEIGGGGHWVGIIFDEPVGKSDGTVKGGQRYFSTDPGRGGFVRGKNVDVGDYPERDIMDEFDSDSEDEL